MKTKLFALALALTFIAGAASAEIVNVEIACTVEYNQVAGRGGVFTDVAPGDDAVATFQVDSGNFIDSVDFGIRSYIIDPSTFQLTIGSAGPVPFLNPQPGDATTYFVVRESDPVSDGFFFSNMVDQPWINPSLDVPGNIGAYMGYHFELDYTGETLPTKDIAALAGVYGRDTMERYYCGVQDEWADAIGFIFQMITITTQTVATEEATWGGVKALYR